MDLNSLNFNDKLIFQAINKSNEIIYIVKWNIETEQGDVIFFTERSAQILGFSSEDKNLLNTEYILNQVIHPADKEHFLETSRKLHIQNIPLTRVIRLKHNVTQEYHFYEDKITPYQDENNSFIGHFGIATNISAIKKSLELQTEADLKYQALLQEINDCVLIVNLEGVIEDCNIFTSTTLAYTQNELIGKNLKTLIPDYQLSEFLNYFDNLKTNNGFLKECLIKKRDESEIFIEMQARFIANDKILVHIKDIHYKKQQEENLLLKEFIIHHAPDGIITLNEHGIINYVNQVLGFKTNFLIKEIYNKHVGTLIHELNIEFWPILWAKIKEKGFVKISASLKTKSGPFINGDLRFVYLHFNHLEYASVYFQDSSDRIIAEDLLQKQEERYKVLSEQTGKIIYDLDLKTDQILWSGDIFKCVGYTTEEFARIDLQQWEAMIHPEDRGDALRLLSLAMENNDLYKVEYRFIHRNGTYIYIEDNGVFILDEFGKAKRMLGVMGDISDRKANENLIIESEKVLRTFLDSGPEAILIYDALTNQLIDFNANSFKLFGYDKEIFKNLHPKDINPKYQANGLLSKEESRKWLKKALNNEEPRFEWTFKNSAGEELLTDIHLILLPYSGKKLIRLSITDIREQKATLELIKFFEARTKIIFDNSSDAIALFKFDANNELKIDIVNSTFLNITKKDLSEIQNKRLDEIMEEESHNLVKENFLDAIVNKKPVHVIKEIKNKETILYIDLSIIPVLNDSKEIINIISISRDITDKKILEQRLIQSQKMEGIGTLAGGIAHDFNNLLATILTAAEVLQTFTNGDEKAKRFLQHIIDATHRGSSIAKQMLIFARPENNDFKMISISDCANDLNNMFEHFLPKNISIKISINPSKSTIYGDFGMIQQTLLNLIINAKDALSNGGSINIETKLVSGAVIKEKFAVETENFYVCLSVSDTGTGIKPEILKRIFDPFYTTKDIGKGTGLGLSMVMGIVNNHKGFVDVESQIDIGTTFYIYLPYVQEKLIAEPVKVQPTTSKNAITILIVEDESSLAETLRMFFSNINITSLLAADGLEGVELFTKEAATIDLIITDLGMPRMSGKDFIKAVKQIKPDIKIIATSGFIDDGLLTELQTIGVDLILTKPYRLAEIEKNINRLLNS